MENLFQKLGIQHFDAFNVDLLNVSSMNLKRESKHKQHNFPIFTLIYHRKISLTDEREEKKHHQKHISYRIQPVVLFLFIFNFFILFFHIENNLFLLHKKTTPTVPLMYSKLILFSIRLPFHG